MSKRFSGLKILMVVACSLALVFTSIGTAKAWEPKMPVEFIIPAGAGGGADVMARFISPIVSKHKLSPKPWVVINKSAGAGAEGFMYVKGQKGNPHVIIITLDNLFTTPLATGVPFNWRDMTPVAKLALDYFVLWVNADSPYKTAKEYVDAVAKTPGKFVMGGTGAKQEDQIITVQLEQAYGLKFNYVPFKGGGTVAVELVGKHIDSSVNNPAEAVSHMKAGRLRALAVIDSERIDLPDWKNIPTMKEATGKDVAYLMLRGIFMAPGVKQEEIDWYVNTLKKVTETPEWKKYVSDMGLKASFLTGPEFVKWLEEKEASTKALMAAGKLLK
ncbi:MAG: tripartite tricarboxylate transporter substrate binding protein [Deltaproteobacteria bacterium]|nr:tripartite tricarboxylate transporter substrate binding protein [Deltaproteobacteria bacterium]